MPARRAWRDAADWPLQAATLAMLPMMAAMPVMIEWCAAAFATLPAHGVALHLAAMLLPALCLRRPLQRFGRVALRAVVGLLMLAGAVALLYWPGLAGLTLAALLQAAAWSLAWAGPMLARKNTAARSASLPLPALSQTTAAASTASQAALTAVAVLLLGVAIAAAGPAALVAVHTALAALALAGPAWLGLRHVINLPSTKESHS